MDFVYAPKPLPHLDRLPIETILEIVNYVASNGGPKYVNRNLLALSRASWRLNQILTPYIYKHNVKNMGSSGFKWAVSHSNRQVIEQLLNHGGDITSSKSGYPLLMAIKKGDVETLKFLLITVKKDDITKALSQAVDTKKNTVLHWAVSLADVPCVKALLEAGVDVGITNKEDGRPLDYLLKRRQIRHVSSYVEIVRLFLDKYPAEIFKSVRDERSIIDLARTTPLILAVRRRSLEMVNIIIEAGLQPGKNWTLSEFINQRERYRMTALAHICDASNWPCDQEGRDKILAIAKTLLLHGADVNGGKKSDFGIKDGDETPVYRSCLRPPSIDLPHQRLNTIRLQHNIISLLIENGADVKIRNICLPDSDDYDQHFPCIRFLNTAEYYSLYVLDPRELVLDPEDILQDTHPTLKFEEGAPLTTFLSHTPNTWRSTLKSEEDEKAEILYLLQATFRKLLENLDARDLFNYRGGGGRTLLHRAATIPGIFGVRATQILLERGADMMATDEYYETAIKHAVWTRNGNRVAISLLRRWRKLVEKGLIEDRTPRCESD